MSSIIQILRRIGGVKAAPTSGNAGQLALWKAGTASTDAASLYAHDGTQWLEVLDTRGKTVSVPVFTGATAAPASPRFGDLWLNTGTNLLSIWDGATWLSTDPHPVSTGTTAPTAPTSGSLWLDPVKKELQVWDGTRWAHVAFTNVQNTFIQPQVIDVTNASAALHIKQLGTGAALVVEDEANPDATPFVVSANGDVGIGTASPRVALQVERPMPSLFLKSTVGTGNATFGGISGLDSANTAQWFIGKEAAGTNVISLASNISGNILNIQQVGTSDIRVITGGKILFNTIDINQPGVVFHQAGEVWVNKAVDGVAVAFRHHATYVGGIAMTATATTYGTSSDYRLKEDLRPVFDAAARLKSLKPVNFAWKVNGERVDGFIAHEVQAVIPEAVTGAKDAVDADGNPVMQGIDQSKLVPLLTAALQDALKRIEALEARP